MRARFLVGASAAFAIVALTAAHTSAATATALVRSGDAPAGGAAIASISSPAATNRSTLAFQGSTSAIMTKTGSTFALVVQTGDPLPAPLTGTFNGLFDPKINDSGQIVFRANVNSSTLPNDTFVFFYDGGTIEPVTTTSDVRTPADLSNSGLVVYASRLGTLYLWDGLTSIPIASMGTAVPGGGTIRRLGDNPVVNASGVVAFEADVDGAGDGLFTWDSINGILTVAQDGLASPVGGTYGDFDLDQVLAIDAGGRVVFRADLDLAPDSAVFRYDPVGPTTSVIAKEGDLVGVDALTGFDEEYVGTNGAGDVAFEGRFGTSARALVLASGGGLTTLVSGLGTGPREFAARLTSTNRIVWNQGSLVQQYDGAVTTVVSPADATPLGTGTRGRAPSINNLDVVAFRATRTAMYRLKRGTLDVLAVAGGPSPGTGTFAFVSEPAYRRRLVFSANDTAGGILVEATPAGLTKVVAENDPAPIGGTFSLAGPLDQVNAFDVKGRTVAFVADVLSGPVATGLFRTKLGSGVFTVVAKAGDQAPNGALFTAFTNVRTTGARSVFTATLDDGNTGIFVADPPRPMTQVALTGDAAPGGVGTFSAFGTVRAARRRVLFAASIVGGAAQTGYFLWNSDALEKIVVDGDVAPIAGTFTLDPAVGTASIALSGSRVAFVSTIADGSADAGIFLFRNGALSPAVLSGYVTPQGGTFAGFGLEPITLFGRTVVFHSSLEMAGAASALFNVRP